MSHNKNLSGAFDILFAFFSHNHHKNYMLRYFVVLFIHSLVYDGKYA